MLVLAHPECSPEVVAAADVSGSTTALIRHVQESGAARFLVLTECAMGDNIVAANPGVKLPDEAITVVVRSDSSGTTYVFTGHLAEIDENFKNTVGQGKAPQWPKSDKFVKAPKNDGVMAQIKQNPGTIGYVEYAYAIQNKLTHAKLRAALQRVMRQATKNREYQIALGVPVRVHGLNEHDSRIFALREAAISDYTYDALTGALKLTNTRVMLNCCGEHSVTLEKKADAFSRQGKTPMFVAVDQTPAGIVAVADTLQKAVDTAIQLCGAIGYSRDTPLEWIYRYARQARLVDGASEVHKMVLSRQLLQQGQDFWTWG